MGKHSPMSSFARPLLALTTILVQSRMLPPVYGQEEMQEEALSLPLLVLCELVLVYRCLQPHFVFVSTVLTSLLLLR